MAGGSTEIWEFFLMCMVLVGMCLIVIAYGMEIRRKFRRKNHRKRRRFKKKRQKTPEELELERQYMELQKFVDLRVQDDFEAMEAFRRLNEEAMKERF